MSFDDLISIKPIELQRDVLSCQAQSSAIALTIGNFRSLHAGHRRLIGTLVSRARTLGVPAVVLSFHPTAYEIFQRKRLDSPINLLTKRLLLASWGVDRLILQRLDPDFLSMEAEVFIEQILLKRLNTRYLVVGDDFCFGHQRKGDFSLLKSFQGSERSFEVEQIEPVIIDDRRVSTTLISKMSANDEYDDVRLYSGRPWSIVGTTRAGRGLGEQMGYPTLNVPLPPHNWSPLGIFAGVVECYGHPPARAAISIGTRPTVTDSNQRVLEAYLLDQPPGKKPHRIAVHLLHAIRPEKKFDSIAQLKEKMASDVAKVKDYFSYSTVWKGSGL